MNPTPAPSWDVFVTPGISIITPDRPPGVRETYFQAMASTLIYGAREAVLVDAFMTAKQAHALADWVASKGRNLTTIYITHGHGDHWFGVGTLMERFPNARAMATPNTVKVMRQNASPEVLAKVWKAAFPGQIPAKLVVAAELKENVIDLEGQELVAVELGHTDTDHTTCLNVPSIRLVVAGDAAYNDVHLYLAESNAQKRREWIAALDKIESLGLVPWSPRISGPRARTIPGLSRRRGNTFAISTDWWNRRRPRKSFTTRCCGSIRTGYPGGHSGVRFEQSSRESVVIRAEGFRAAIALGEKQQTQSRLPPSSHQHPGVSVGERKMTEAEVLRTHVDLFYGALKSRDWDQLAAIYSDDYMLVRPDGSVLNKQEVLKDLRDQALVFHSIELDEQNVRIYGTVAVLTGESRAVTSRNGKESDGQIRFVAVYVQEGDPIRLVHFQSVPLSEK